MKLLSIKTHGFKSFADKLEINLSSGITGIVGPNGSGKSNIVDAVKWVLGEQSLKNLRGSEKMSDVIFVGSKTRKPMSRAWVSLTFDNSDHYLNSEFDTVEIKRVVYNSGENEYYINNAKVRLKDITELFLDSGSSTNSFSIISQGKISEILSGKEKDRRQIIEEAAGVLKYKKHKEETLKKIALSNDNIEKIDLVINEIENTIEPLKKQRDDAIKYKTIKEEYDNLDIVLTLVDLKNCDEVINKLKIEIDSINADINNINTFNSTDNSNLERLKLNSTNIDIKLNELREKLININKEISDNNANKQLLLERKKYEVDDIKLQDNIILLKEKELKINKDIDLILNKLNTLSSDKDNILLKIKKNDLDINSNNNEYNKLLEQRNSINIKILNIKNKINILESNINNMSTIPSSVKNVLSSRRLKGIHDIVGNIVSIDDVYKDALSIAISSNLNVVITDNVDSAKKAINYLKEEKLGRCTFYPLDIIKPKYVKKEDIDKIKDIDGYINTLDSLVTYDNKYNNIIKNLMGNIIVVDNIDTMNKIGKILNYSYRIVTIDGSILHTGGSLTGGSIYKGNNCLLDKLELNSLNKELEINNNNLLNINNKIDNLYKKLNDFNKIKDNNNNDLNNIDSVININNKLLDELNIDKNNILNELNGNNDILKNSIDNSLNIILENYYELVKNKELLENDINKLKLEKDDILTNISEIELNNKKINSNYNKLINSLKDNEIELSKYEIKMDNNLIKLNEEHHMTYEYAIGNYDTDIDIKSSTSRYNTIKRELSLIGNVNLGSIEEYDRINNRFTYLTNEKKDIVNSINNLLNVINDLDNTMIEKFSDTFNKVNKEFNVVFKRLFKGGTAELILTDPNDLLNTGIIINACPPGKTLKGINLLSGGEKTLTAIALLFAILNIRYVPFSILDEVEAALDEANVDMFGNYIKEYKDKTQFIIITHKKRTMEYANTLYGITMQESGVSKLVSVNLDNID